MANYIKEEILCEAYTHLNTDIYNNKEALNKLKKHLLPYFEERAKFLLGDDINVIIEFEEGSLKTKLKVIGSAGVILAGAITAYPTFKEGVHQLALDSSALAQSANLEVIFRTKTPYCDRVTIEKRKGIFGRVDELLTQLDSLRAIATKDEGESFNIRLIESTKVVEQLILWSTRIDKLFDKIESLETEECISGGLYEALKRMPKKLKWDSHLENESLKTKIAKSDPDMYGRLKGVSSQYTATIESIKSKMKKRYDLSKEKLDNNIK